MDARKRQCLAAMGIARWVPRGVAESLPDEASETVMEAPGWSELEQRVAACTGCDLHRSRTQTVFGVGDRAARWMIVGEAPGEQEDLRGEPFVGRSGKLLDAMLLAMGLARQDVYIANILKCRPPDNRNPTPEEASHCAPYLRRQMELINPGIILAVGLVAAQRLLDTKLPLARLRGELHSYGDNDTPLVVTYHPAYLLRAPLQKKKAWQDLLLARSVLTE